MEFVEYDICNENLGEHRPYFARLFNKLHKNPGFYIRGNKYHR
jgi:hypothetical protein